MVSKKSFQTPVCLFRLLQYRKQISLPFPVTVSSLGRLDSRFVFDSWMSSSTGKNTVEGQMSSGHPSGLRRGSVRGKCHSLCGLFSLWGFMRGGRGFGQVYSGAVLGAPYEKESTPPSRGSPTFYGSHTSQERKSLSRPGLLAPSCHGRSGAISPTSGLRDSG